MKYELFLAIRHLKARSRRNIISVITIISIIGITLGVACLIIVLAVMTGFTDELRDKMLSINAHINMFPRMTKYFIGYEKVIDQLLQVKGIHAASPFILMEIQVRKNQESPVPLRLKGIDPNLGARVTSIKKYIVEGDYAFLEPGKNNIVLGSDLMEQLGVKVGDNVQLIIPFGKTVGGIRVPKLETMHVTGKFHSGMYQYDASFGYVHFSTVQTLFNLKDTVSGIEIRLDNLEHAEKISLAIKDFLGKDFFIQPWTSTNKSFFAVMKLQKYALFIILLLIVCVACFNIINSLLMKVMEKKREIGMLKAMGAQSGSIMRIFLYEGGMVGILGTVLGLLLGSGLCLIGNKFQILKVKADVYYLSCLPLKVLPIDIFFIISASILISLVVTIIPSFQAARQNPVDAIRYE